MKIEITEDELYLIQGAIERAIHSISADIIAHPPQDYVPQSIVEELIDLRTKLEEIEKQEIGVNIIEQK